MIALALCVLLPSSARAADPHEHHHQESLPPAAPATDSIFNLAQQWTNDAGAKVSLKSLAGQPLVVAMIYTSCQAACPMIVSDMKRIEAALPDKQRDRVRFVLFSFDPARDSVQRMNAYRKERGLAGERWVLLRASDDEVRELAAVLGLRYKRLPNGDFQHSNLVSIIDNGGVIRRQVSGLGEDPAATVALLQQLAP
jgi:protein SCO1/2